MSVITKKQAQAILQEINGGYHDQKRDDYPPYALASWDDRNRFTDYIERVLNRLAGGKRT